MQREEILRAPVCREYKHVVVEQYTGLSSSLACKAMSASSPHSNLSTIPPRADIDTEIRRPIRRPMAPSEWLTNI